MQTELAQYYVDVLCYVRTIPWRKDSAVPINNFFKTVSLFHRQKTSKRDTEMPLKPSIQGPLPSKDTLNFTSGIFNSEEKSTGSETLTPLKKWHNDIFKIEQNKVCPRRILVNGNPGVGKSTLLCKLAHDWAVENSDSPLKDVKLLIHLSLRDLQITAMIGDQVRKQLLSKDSHLSRDQIETCIRENSRDIVMLLDGFDESVFAYLTDTSETPKEYGSLFAAIKYEEFRPCRILVTVRSWKESHFRGDLFNPYAEIFISGLVPSSIKSFIGDYCNEGHAKKMRDVITEDLTNLRPILRVPLFLAMICEIVSNEEQFKAPFTLTSLIKQFCEYLFKQYKDRYNELPLSSEECLGALGKEALESYMIEVTPDVNLKVLEFSLKVGLLSTSQKKYLDPSSNQTKYYFVHSLLRDFCVAHYFYNTYETMDPRNPVLTDSLDINRWYYVLLFQCGMTHSAFHSLCGNFGKSIIGINSLINPARKCNMPVDIANETLLVQCYFENHILMEYHQIPDLFSQIKCIAIKMDLLNSLSAADYLLNRCKQSQRGFCINEFDLMGENYVHIVEKDTENEEDDYSFRTLEIGYLKKMISKCQYLTSIYLMDSTITLDQKPHEKHFDNSIEIHIVDCRGLQAITSLMFYLSSNFPNIKKLRLQNIRSATSHEELLDLQDMFQLISKVTKDLKSVFTMNMVYIHSDPSFPSEDPIWLKEDTGIYVGDQICAKFPNMKEALMMLTTCLNEEGVLSLLPIDTTNAPSAEFLTAVKETKKLHINLRSASTCDANLVFSAAVKDTIQLNY